MSGKDEVDIDHLADLCRIQCSEEEKQKIKRNLDKVINYVALLTEIDTTGVSPCVSVVETLSNVTQEDEVKPGLERDVFIANAPDHVGGMIKIPTVIQVEE